MVESKTVFDHFPFSLQMAFKIFLSHSITIAKRVEIPRRKQTVFFDSVPWMNFEIHYY